MNSAKSAADAGSQIVVQVYSKLASTLSVPDVAGSASDSILSLQFPGQYIEPNLDFRDAATQYAVSNVCDRVLLCGWTVVQTSGTVSDVYKLILDGKETPNVSLKPAEKKKLQEAQEYLFDATGQPSAAYGDYQKYQAIFFAALDNYEAAAATKKNGGAAVPPKVIKEREVAEKNWRKSGHKDAVEAAVATIATYESMEPEVFWLRLLDRYAAYTRRLPNGSEFQFVDAYPPYTQWFEDFGWSDFSFDGKDFSNQARSGGIGGDFYCPYCPYRGGVVAGDQKQRGVYDLAKNIARNELAVSDITLTCRVKRVEILRPWMNINVFYSRAWRWSRAAVGHGVKISSGGDIAGGEFPVGAMPVLPKTMILARDLVLTWKDSERVSLNLPPGEPIAFGPFNLSKGRRENGKIDQPDPQVIGYVSTMLPRCPNPDSTLPWPTLNDTGEWLTNYHR